MTVFCVMLVVVCKTEKLADPLQERWQAGCGLASIRPARVPAGHRVDPHRVNDVRRLDLECSLIEGRSVLLRK